MKKVLVFLFSLISFSCFCQSLDSIKHIEIISEIKDSMALINKDDIDVINKTFYELEISDSLNTINDSIIEVLTSHNCRLDSILQNQKAIIQNEQVIKNQLIEDHSSEIDFYKKELKRSNSKKIMWQSTTGISFIAIILILLM